MASFTIIALGVLIIYLIIPLTFIDRIWKDFVALRNRYLSKEAEILELIEESKYYRYVENYEKERALLDRLFYMLIHNRPKDTRLGQIYRNKEYYPNYVKNRCFWHNSYNRKQCTVVAKSLSGADEDSSMYESKTQRDDVCPICHNRILDIPDVTHRVIKRKANLLHTYDSYCIVSSAFKQFCIDNQYPDLEFIELGTKGCYFFKAHRKYQLDYKNGYGMVNFRGYRSCCGSFDGVTGYSPYIQPGFTIPSDDFIYSSDWAFGEGAKKHPQIIVGLKTMEKMQQAGLSGIYYHDIYSKNDPINHQ